MLGLVAHEAQVVYDQEAGRSELLGAGYLQAYKRVNTHYERHSAFGGLIYWFAWALRKRLHLLGLIPMFLSIALLILFDNNQHAIGSFAAWLE